MRHKKEKGYYLILYQYWSKYAKRWGSTDVEVFFEKTEDGEEHCATSEVDHFYQKKEAKEVGRSVVDYVAQYGVRIRFALIPVHKVKKWIE